MELDVDTTEAIEVKRRPQRVRQARPAPAHSSASAVSTLRRLLADLMELTKPEISLLVTVSALAGFLFGSPGGLEGWVLLATLLGVSCTAGGAGVLNHMLERNLDAKMRRTADRPLPAERITARTARYFGASLIGGGLVLLVAFVNTLTAALAALTVVLYLLVYTPLKQVTTYNTLVGTVPGALPALGGWTAATGSFGWGGWAIFAILVLWQIPHFLSLAWMYRQDYARANYVMLPVVEPSGSSTAALTLGSTVLLLGVSMLPVIAGVAGWVYFAGALFLGTWFIVPCVAFYRSRSGRNARRVLVASIYYIPMLVALIGADWIL